MASAFDMGGIFLLGLFAYTGIRQGLIQGAMKLVGATVALYATMNHSGAALLILKPFWEPPGKYASIIGFVITFVVVLYAFNFVAWILKRAFKHLHLGAVDRVGGLAFGMVKAGLILSAFVWAFMLLPVNMRGDWQQESRLYPVVDVFQASVLRMFGWEDELLMFQSAINSMVSNPGEGISDAMMEKLMEMLPDDQKAMLDEFMEISKGGGDASALQKKLLEMGGDNPVLQQYMDQMQNSQTNDAWEQAVKQLEN